MEHGRPRSLAAPYDWKRMEVGVDHVGIATGEKRRLPTGVAGLDEVLQGGLLRGAQYLVTGGPGTGKTVLCSQVAFHRAAAGENVLYVTSFSESHARLLSNLESFSFFDRSLIQSRITLLSGVTALEEGGLEPFQSMLGEAVRTHRASLLVIDSLGAIAELASSPFAYRKFLRELGALLSLVGCTALLIVPRSERPENVEPFLADGILDLELRIRKMRQTRELAVRKFRGSPHLSGQHIFEIGASGLTVYPRRETLLLSRELDTSAASEKSRFGIAGLDDMLRGGVPPAAVTALLGAPGSGKTLLGLHLLAEGLRLGQRCLYFGFYETPSRLLTKAEGVGLRLREHVEAGRLEVQWRQPTEQFLDAIAAQLVEGVHRQKARRLFIDGVDGLLQAAAHPERFTPFFTALTNELRALHVSTAISMETSFGGPELGLAPVGLSACVENIVFMRYVELRSQFHRLISVLKVRESDYDPSLREFRITSRGLEVAGSSESAEEVLGQLARLPGGTPARPGPKPQSPGFAPEDSGEDA
ncbi:circadian clock protein KaiC [Archangium gephyra]|uniref:non-specific serine/threonine protein kinase n=1 Tax=Archangium gephyra TaxID=48 RepID=A0AAC8TFY6_9BACT|nr:ATPase domain-containing protein [Archangium gephyra]AKJ03061.1 Circadian clock protein KaiC [Archangium gephyra]REG25185.1 circadian clock protein KaiC [Archangium gephyra]